MVTKDVHSSSIYKNPGMETCPSQGQKQINSGTFIQGILCSSEKEQVTLQTHKNMDEPKNTL